MATTTAARPDLYQLVLSVSRGHHNCSAVLSREGVYYCSMDPSTTWRIERELRAFLKLNAYTSEMMTRSIQACESPRTQVLERMRAQHPLLWNLFQRARELYRNILKDKARPPMAEQIKRFVEGMAPLGLRIVFVPAAHPPV